MKHLIAILFMAVFLSASDVNFSNQDLTLEKALEILKSQNLEVKVADLSVKSARAKEDSVSGMRWGKLDLIQDVARSNDAGKVFGFKLTSREADFGDFGFADFLGGVVNVMGQSGPDFNKFYNYMKNPQTQQQMLDTQPEDLNYPGYQNFFQTKLKYEVPLFTGFKITSYADIMKAMTKMKNLEKEQVMQQKRYEVRKSFYDMALLKSSIKHLQTILNNINILENMTQKMIEVGYAKKVDLLEVRAKKGNVERLISQMKSNEKLLYHYLSFLLNQKVEHIITPQEDVPMPQLSDKEILDSNIDIKRAKTGLHIRKSMIEASEANYYPMVGAFAEVATADDTFFGDADDHKAYTFGARLSWNLFNGGIDSAKIEQAKVEQLQTKTQVELAKKGIALKIAKIKTQIEAADLEIESLQKELALADEIYKSYEARYKEKLASMSDVIIKQSQQIEKILQLQMAKNKRNERIFALEKLANGDR